MVLAAAAVTCRGVVTAAEALFGLYAERRRRAQFERLVRVVLDGRLGVVGHIDELQSTHLRQRSLGATGAGDEKLRVRASTAL